MDLKNFKDVDDNAKDAGKKATKKISLDDAIDHSESDKIIKDLEMRIAQINKKDEVKNSSNEKPLDIVNANQDVNENDAEENVETQIVEVIEEKTFLEKIQPFILPIFITIFALFFAALFLYFFSQGTTEKTLPAISNVSSQPEVIVVRDTKPEVKEPIIIEEKFPECDPKTQVLNVEENVCDDLPPPPPSKKQFENGITANLKVSFSYDKFNYDNKPRGIYLNGEQEFEGEFEGFKLNPSNRPFANDFFFGIDRYMVSLIGTCKFVVDDAEILVKNLSVNENAETFQGEVVKIVDASKPHVVCK